MTFIPVRLRREHARGERDRVCHLVPAPAEHDAALEKLIALCGVEFTPGIGEALRHLAGMPCEPCLAAASRTLSGNQPAAPSPRTARGHSPVPTFREPPSICDGQAALGLRDEHLVHRVSRDEIVSILDGVPVTLTRCGVLARPVACEPAAALARCADCAPSDPAWPTDQATENT